jgi:monoamine oxidase
MKFPLLSALLGILAAVSTVYGNSNWEMIFEDQTERFKEIYDHGFQQCQECKDIVVVGCGVAGLMSSYLLSSGGHNVTCVEAASRLGGRIETYKHEGSPNWVVDLGAMRIINLQTMVIHILEDYGVALRQFQMHDPNSLVSSAGKTTTRAIYEKNPNILLTATLEDNEEGKTGETLMDEALAEPIKDAQNAPLDYIHNYDPYSIKTYLQHYGYSDHAIDYAMQMVTSEEILYTSITEAVEDSIIFSNETLLYYPVGGMMNIVDALHKKAMAAGVKIVLNSTVSDIEWNVTSSMWSTAKSAVVYTTEGQDDATRLIADNVIISTTAKAAQLISYSPSLPWEKTTSLAQIHYDSATKVAMFFSERWWSDIYNIQGGYSITDRPIRLVYFLEPMDANEPGGTALVYTWGDASLLLTSMPDDVLVSFVLKEIATLFSNASEIVKSSFVKGVTKKWTMDEYSHGAFALLTPGTSVHIQPEQAIPIGDDGEIRFSGDHTALPHAWMETSLRTAIRQSAQISSEFCDITVIGGGPLGLSTAYYASQYLPSAKICVIEKYDIGNAEGSSPGESRQFRQMYDEEYLSLDSTESYSLWRDIEALTNISILNVSNGYCFWGDTSTAGTTEGGLNSIMATCDAVNLDCIQYNSTAFEAMYPFNADSFDEAVCHNESGWIDVQAAMMALQQLCESNGVVLRQNESIIFATAAADADSSFKNPNASFLIGTTRGLIETNKVVTAGGPYTNDITRLFGYEIDFEIWELASAHFKLLDQDKIIPTWLYFGSTVDEIYYGFPEADSSKGYVRIAPLITDLIISNPSQRSKSGADKLAWTINKTIDFVEKYVKFANSSDFYSPNHTCLASQLHDNGFVLSFAPKRAAASLSYNREDVVTMAGGWAFKFIPLFGRTAAEMIIDGQSEYYSDEFSIERSGVLLYPVAESSGYRPRVDLTIGFIVFGVLLVIA